MAKAASMRFALFDTDAVTKSGSAATSTIGRPATTSPPKDAKRLDRFTQFAMVAGIDAVSDSGLDFSQEDPFRCGVILGSGIGGLHEIETQIERLLHKGPDKVSAFTIPKLMVNAASGQVSIQYGLRGPNTAVATACASATNAIGDAFKAIQYDDADMMITGGTEAAITPMGISGFANMRAFRNATTIRRAPAGPFDRDRDGFVLSEGAGMLVFEELEHARTSRSANLRRSARLRRQRRRRPHHPARRRRHRRRPGDGAGTGRRRGRPDRDRLHQRPRHQHAAGRSGRNEGHQDGSSASTPGS